MAVLNLGILAHVDAGKTSLTERILFETGVIGTIGSVDDGSTQTDTLELERQRGITIRSAVVSFVIDDVTVNLVDTPGHPDFIAEVDRVLSVLDAAVVVISAVEGVQAQTRVLLRALQRLRLPFLIFVNKIDRSGAEPERVLDDIAEKLTPAIIPMGRVDDPGTRDACSVPSAPTDGAFRTRLLDLLTRHDDALLAACLDDELAVSCGRLRAELVAQTGRTLIQPVFFGSAMTGAGVDALIHGIATLLPATTGDADGPLSGTVFKIERDPAGQKLALVRLFSGTLRARDRVTFRQDNEGKVTAIHVFDRGGARQSGTITAGQIGTLAGLHDIQVGDTIGISPLAAGHGVFAPPTLEAVIAPCHPAEAGALRVALAQLAEQDPLINVRFDDRRRDLIVSLYGEVQKEVIQATLVNEFNVAVTFRETTTICVERPAGVGAAVEFNGKDDNPFLATVGLRVEPAPMDAGVVFQLDTSILGTMPAAFFVAVEETVLETLRQGLHGWQITDCTVTMTHSGYSPRQSHAHAVFDKSMSSTAGDFRNLTPLVLMAALREAGTSVYEPLHRFYLDIPEETLQATWSALVQLGAVPSSQRLRGSSSVLEGEIPAAQVHLLRQQLPALTRGEGVLETAFERYELVQGTIPTRPRTDHNPLNRKEYLLHVMRGV